MSDLRVNIRILWWHLQVTNTWKFSVTYNDFHKGFPKGMFKVYDWKPFTDNSDRNQKG